MVTVCKAHKVAVLPGDGIGPEIMDAALKVLTAAGKKEGQTFEFTKALIGGAAIDATGSPLPKETLDVCKASDAVLLAAIGGCVRTAAAGTARPRAAFCPVCATPRCCPLHACAPWRLGPPRCARCRIGPQRRGPTPPPPSAPSQLQVGQPARRAASRARPARPARGPQRLCQPAPRHRAQAGACSAWGRGRRGTDQSCAASSPTAAVGTGPAPPPPR